MADVHVSHVVHPAENGGPLLSAAEQDDVVVDEDSVQFRVMRAYVRRRRPQDRRLVTQVNVAPVALPSVEPVVEAETKKGRRSGGIKSKHDCNQLFKDLLGSYSLFDKLMSAIFRKMVVHSEPWTWTLDLNPGNQQAVHR
ncbi:hypothetical protein CRUP_022008 [Coryphaenoides rupestris]|nr:hypothetical protein CRUP_022008 [Coryphaenoides rupestris]